MIVVDASVWVSALHPQDAQYQASNRSLVRWIEEDEIIVVPTIFLVEVAGAIARRTRDSVFGQRAIKEIRENPLIRLIGIDPVLADLAANVAVDVFLRGADAVYVALAANLKIPLITWDQEQLTRASTLVTVRSPML